MKAIEKIIENGQKVIVRTEKAGVFYGIVTEFENNYGGDAIRELAERYGIKEDR